MAQFNAIVPTIQSSGATWAQFKAGGVKGILDLLASTNTAIANPSVTLTAAQSVASGCLPAGTYYASYTFCDPYGETTPGTSESVLFTSTGLAQLWTLTLPALPSRAQYMNVYVTPTNGAAGSERLVYTGQTTTSLALTNALTFPAVDQPEARTPLVNTTGLAAHYDQVYALIANRTTELQFERLSEDVSQVLKGQWVDLKSIYGSMQSWKGIVATWNQIFTEINTLLAANFPSATLPTGTYAIGYPKRGWILP